jgi:hypothetical protein
MQMKLSISSIYAKARKAAKLFDRINERVKQFLKPAEPIAQGRRWGEMLARIIDDFGLFPLKEKVESTVLVTVLARIWA